MQFGAPTLSSNATSMPEVAGDAAFLLTPHDPDVWTQAMLDLASDQGKEAMRSPKRANRNQTTSHTGDPLVENVG